MLIGLMVAGLAFLSEQDGLLVKVNPGALETVPGHYFDRARSLPAAGLHPGKSLSEN